jgi:hypothetical protein
MDGGTFGDDDETAVFCSDEGAAGAVAAPFACFTTGGGGVPGGLEPDELPDSQLENPSASRNPKPPRKNLGRPKHLALQLKLRKGYISG